MVSVIKTRVLTSVWLNFFSYFSFYVFLLCLTEGCKCKTIEPKESLILAKQSDRFYSELHWYSWTHVCTFILQVAVFAFDLGFVHFLHFFCHFFNWISVHYHWIEGVHSYSFLKIFKMRLIDQETFSGWGLFVGKD